jgi:SPP1 gp7 family putative phage head morphogenesis protein
MALTPEQQAQADRNKAYWAKREEEALKHYIKDEAEYDKKIDSIYKSMLDACQNEINAFYGRYASKENITMAEAKKRVSEADIAAYERKAKKYVKDKDFSKEANEEMRLYNLMMKVNHLEMLKANIGLELIAGHDELQKFMEEILQGRTEEELARQAGILGKTIKNNSQLAHSIVNASFHNAKFSDRIWMYQDLLRADLDKLLQTGLIQGKNPRVLAREIKSKFETSTYNAERLMRTEMARVQTDAQKQSFERNGFDKYIFIVNASCCDICHDVAKRKTKHGVGVYLVSEMMPGDNASPIHPHCRCSAAAYSDEKEYQEWLNYLANGGTSENFHKMKAKSGTLTNRRKERLAARKAKESVPTNKDGKEIVFKDNILKKEWSENVEMIKKLAGEYNTKLQEVDVGAKNAGGTVGNFGTTMRLSNKEIATTIHEFAHTIAIEQSTKLKLEDQTAFWKEIKSVRRAYRKYADEPEKWISHYAHTDKSIDEFFADAFTHAKLAEMRLEKPDRYGDDYTYSKKVLEITDKYFKKKK